MAADGAWPKSTPEDSPDGGGAPARALSDLQDLVGQMEAWMVSLEATPIGAAAAEELARSVEALGRRVDRADAPVAGGLFDLAAKLSALAKRLQGQLEESREVAGQMLAAEAPSEPVATPLAARPARRPAFMFTAAGGVMVLAVAGVGLSLRPATTAPVMATAPAVAAMQAPQFRPSLSRPRTAPPPPAAPAGVTPATPAAVAPASSVSEYAAAIKALERGDPRGVTAMLALAQRGYPPAQLQAAALHETGAPGAPRDIGQARAWTRRAADGGDRVAMHNLALFMLNGEGGARDIPQAARWFHKAAGLGVVDSQHNLGLLYESGLGVEKNLREAYRWFTVAANAGDGASREKAVEVEARLTGRERAGVETEAQGFRPGPAAASAEDVVIIPPATTLAATQALLARMGYYVGPTDGTPSPALKAATRAYLKDHPEVTASSGP